MGNIKSIRDIHRRYQELIRSRNGTAGEGATGTTGATYGAQTAAAASTSQPSLKREQEKTKKQQETKEMEEMEETKEMEEIEKMEEQLKGLTLEPGKVLVSPDLRGVAECIATGRAKNVVVMLGAGASTAAGIPDFRTPGTGLYSNLKSYNLPYPQAVFEISYFKENPEPFFLLSKSLWPSNFVPTKTHCFIRLLHEMGILRKCFTQNIDSLEHQAGVPKDKIIPAHGNFDSATVVTGPKQGTKVPIEEVEKAVREEDGYSLATLKEKYQGLVKPDVVFFGESLPMEFSRGIQEDLPNCDLLIVVGTSLKVMPFAGLIHDVGRHVPRVLINRERVGEDGDEDVFPSFLMGMGGSSRGGFNFDSPDNADALYLGDCDDGVEELVKLLGPTWWRKLQQIEIEVRKSASNAASSGTKSAPPSGNKSTAKM